MNAALDDSVRRLFDADVDPRLAELIYSRTCGFSTARTATGWR
ncbi:hypothetical protein QSJ19_26120 [Gordonia sp. ABSL11-1]|nr:hypothetical protein [Gordonia sp. ABSL11-1]MDL9948994.1 hypothetical protein [Gordonia sp. ABSL11-1]